MIAVVKDLLIYITVIAAVIIIPAELGGYAKIFASVDAEEFAAGARRRRQIWARKAPMQRWRWARHWRCFFIPMR